MDDLTHALETATEGCRDLDRMIIASLPYVLERRGPDRKAWWYRTGSADRHRYSDEQHAFRDGIPRYTTSVDAAITLVPEGHWWQVA